MISYDRYQTLLAQSDAATREAAGQAFQALLKKIRAGEKPRPALDAVLREFNADAIAGFREALNAILQSSLGVAEVKAYKVGKVKLSAALYSNAQAVSASAQRIIDQHLQGLHDARELRKALYEGYDFQTDPLDVVKPLPKYLKVEFDRFKAAKLKTPALRAAYLEAIRQKEAGAGMEQLKKTLKVAFYERNRYFANRIARTELHRNYTDRLARELMAEDQIQYVQIRLSSKHPKTDICDRHAKLDAWGLGPGVYPKAEAPKPPFHPHCLCLTAARIDLFPKQPPRFNPEAERDFLAKLPPHEARQVAGSREKLERALKGDATLEDIYNEGKDPLYRWQRMGEVGQDAGMENDLRNLVSRETYEAVRATLQARTLPPTVVDAGLTEAEQVALHLWTRDTGKEAWFRQINQALRDGDADALKRLQPLIEAMRNGLGKLPPFVGVVYRGIKERGFQGDFAQWAERLQPKEIIEDLGFAGSSVDLEQKLRGRVKWIIQSKTGKDISALSHKPEQTEVLFGAGSKFIIDRVNIKQNGVIELWATQLDN
jgi:hypothetical protein